MISDTSQIPITSILEQCQHILTPMKLSYEQVKVVRSIYTLNSFAHHFSIHCAYAMVITIPTVIRFLNTTSRTELPRFIEVVYKINVLLMYYKCIYI